MGQPKIVPMIEKLYPEILKVAEKMHKEGRSWDAISRVVSDEVGIDVSREVLRKWHKGLEELAAQKAAAKA